MHVVPSVELKKKKKEVSDVGEHTNDTEHMQGHVQHAGEIGRANVCYNSQH